MAVFKIFPEKDTFIYTEQAVSNAGLDEIIELGGYPVDSYGMTSRILVQFPQDKIKEVVEDHANNQAISASLHMYLASGYELPEGYTVEAFPISESWTNGVGKYLDSPIDSSGVSWYFRSANQLDRWGTPETTTMQTGTTSSYDARFAGGGGNWWHGVRASQKQALNSDHDINLDVTRAVNLHYTGSIGNNGLIVKLTDDLEFNTTSSIRMKYYSGDTNTIYPPTLNIKWDDSSYNPGDLELLSTSNATISITNNKGTFKEEGKQRFRLAAKPKYPTRTFTTSSIYLQNYALPSNTTWGIKDEHSEEMIIDFDANCTKVSCDENGPYFDVYMDGLQPERYYRLLIKTTLDGSDMIVDDKNIFKVVRNV